MTESMRDEMRSLIVRHCDTLRVEAEAVRQCLEKLGDPAATSVDVVSEGVAHAHKIKGSSGTIGFMDVSDVARKLEACLRDLVDAGRAPGGGEISTARELGALLIDKTSTLRPEDSGLYSAF